MKPSSNSKLARMEKVDLRNVWAREAEGFTPWLARDENIEELGKALGLDLEVQRQEAGVGPFRADILCKEVDSDRVVVIENQIEETDHSHLGQLLTYAAGVGAFIVIWVAKSFSEEHRAALDWLNENSSGKIAFFGVEVELWTIAGSPPAPRFNVVSKPNKWTERIQKATRVSDLTKTQQLRVEYWSDLGALLKEAQSSLRCAEPTHRYYLLVHCPIQGFRCGFEIAVRDKQIRVYLGASKKENVELLHRVRKNRREALEKDLGAVTEWTNKWVYTSRGADPLVTRDWRRQHEWMKNTLEKLVSVFPKYATHASTERRGAES